VNPTYHLYQISVAFDNGKLSFLRETERSLWIAILNASLGSPETDELNHFLQTFDAPVAKNQVPSITSTGSHEVSLPPRRVATIVFTLLCFSAL
jgi:hypothetical protein